MELAAYNTVPFLGFVGTLSVICDDIGSGVTLALGRLEFFRMNIAFDQLLHHGDLEKFWQTLCTRSIQEKMLV